MSRHLRNPVLTYIGKVSYAMYLIHIYAFIAVLKISQHLWGKAWQPGIGSALTAALLAIGLASISWHLFEVPVLSLKERYFPRSPLQSPAEAGLVHVLDFPAPYAHDEIRKVG